MATKDTPPPASTKADATAELSKDEIREMLKRHGVEQPEVSVTDEEAEAERDEEDEEDDDGPATDED